MYPSVEYTDDYTDPRLVALYDTLNPFGADTAFYIDLAAQVSAATIVDVGCGTGMLACELARRGYRMIGVDPSPAMLDVARQRPGGDRVYWVEGDAGRLDEIADVQADLALMTGHVAQIIADDQAWQAALPAIHRALRPSGHVAFESLNPAGRPWTRWTPEASRRQLEDTALGPVVVWYQIAEVQDGRVRAEAHYHLLTYGEHPVSVGELRFRTESELTRSLTEAGFAVEHVLGDWQRHPVSAERPEFIVVAAR